MRRSEFCQSRGLSFSTLDRHLKKLRWKRRRKPISSAGRLVPVELAARKSPTQQEPSCALAVVLPGGRRIEVHPDFDTSTFERWWASWSGRKPCLDWAQLHGSMWPPGSPTCARGSKSCTVSFGIDCRVSSERAPVLVLQRPAQSTEGPRLRRKRTLGLCQEVGERAFHLAAIR
jgi:hypothetical protein